MVTKGIIERVLDFHVHQEAQQRNNNRNAIVGVVEDAFKKYRVRLPIFHSLDERSGIDVDDLPIGIYAAPPGMEKVAFHVGDVVLVSIEDMQLDSVIILGMYPSLQSAERRDLSGAFESETTMVLEKVDSIQMSPNGTMVLPKNTSLTLDGGDSISKEDFSMLKGITKPIQQQLDEIGQKIRVVSQDEFEALQDEKKLQADTLYFVYNGSTFIDPDQHITGTHGASVGF